MKELKSSCRHIALKSVLRVRKHDVLHIIVVNIAPCQYKRKRCLTVKTLIAYHCNSEMCYNIFLIYPHTKLTDPLCYDRGQAERCTCDL